MRIILTYLVAFSIAFSFSYAAAQDQKDVWVYKQSSGELWLNGKTIGKGYSGHGKSVNNPEAEKDANVGPIPRGEWTIGDAFTHETKGPVVMRLTPFSGTNTFGRSGFLIHGDNSKVNQSASEGCIILGPAIRKQIAGSKIKRLLVIR